MIAVGRNNNADNVSRLEDAMSTATTERDVLHEMIEASRQRIAQLEQDVAFERRYLADLVNRRGNLPKDDSNVGKKKRDRPVLSKGSIEPGSVTDQIVTLLKERGQTMRAADIARELVDRGATTTAKKGMLPMVLSSLSRRRNLFQKVGRGQYRLLETNGATEES